MTTPSKLQARRKAKADFPLAVGPAMRIAETRVNGIVALDLEDDLKSGALFGQDHAGTHID